MERFWASRGPILKERVIRKHRGPAIVFVHGLGGKKGSWAKMVAQCEADSNLSGHTLSFYEYPSRRFAWPWVNVHPGLNELAKGLQTELETKHKDRDDVTLVAHSLGGLVARQYIVNQLKNGKKPLVTRLLLIAAPNTGASLAKIGSRLSYNQPLLRQLCRGDYILDHLNRDWRLSSSEARVTTKYVVGGMDGIVPPESAVPFFGQDNVATLIGYDHFDIIDPADTADMRYLVLRDFVLAPVGPLPEEAEHRTAERKADPLFDVYALQNEPFYTLRHVDPSVKQCLDAGAVWVVGPTGTGKTAALMRSALVSGWQLQQIVLAAHACQTADDLLYAICLELASLRSIDDAIDKQATIPAQFSFIKKALRTFPSDKIVVLLVEELPIGPGLEFNRFVELMGQLSLAIDADNELSRRFVLAFSSINDPTSGNAGLTAKTSERIQLIHLRPWTIPELANLAKTLSVIIRPELTEDEIRLVAEEAKGSPRFVKNLFRKWRNGSAESRSLKDLLALVRNELS